ncbi:hypothetical protein O181_085978 [Austropuccinia psidii MF-1]|uniref:Uncharacterized protein n=1 Tax=Austropuccinia psidii MF-1 TaxID=1389203 RepID=A0A9Q3ILX2_9BASI|nr:hypothetical protein [Austropuccinia psidii MF-1]
MSQRDRLGRPYSNYQRLESHKGVQTPGGEGKQDEGESRHYPSYTRTADPDREYSDSFRLTRSRPNEPSSGFIPVTGALGQKYKSGLALSNQGTHLEDCKRIKNKNNKNEFL